MTGPNPFTPAFGTIPAVMAGRNDILADMRAAFEADPGNPSLSTILMGACGSGKTVCMSCICDDAREHGWLSVRTTAKPGMLEDPVESRLSDVARRMGVKSNYASKYKTRLLVQGVIGERSRSNVFGFEIPGFREFLERLERELRRTAG